MSNQATPQPLSAADISRINQNIARKFVEAEVYCSVGSMVEYTLSDAGYGEPPFTWDDVENVTYESVEENQVRFIVETNNSTKDEEISDYLAHFYRIDEDGDDEDEPFLTVTLDDILMARNQEALELDEIEDGHLVYNFMTQGYLVDHPHPAYADITILSEYEDVARTEETNEVYEWWAVSGWLHGHLKYHNECVIDTDCYIWGRGSSGQAIYLDSVITDILRDMEYLHGQRYGDRYAD